MAIYLFVVGVIFKSILGYIDNELYFNNTSTPRPLPPGIGGYLSGELSVK